MRQISLCRRRGWLITLIVFILNCNSNCGHLFAKGRGAQKKPVAKAAKAAATKAKPPIKVAAAPQSPQLTAAIVTWPTGAVVLRNNKKLIVKAGTLLQAGDVLLGAPSGNLDIRVGGQGTMSLKPKSKLVLKTLLRQSKNDPNTIDNRLKLELGTLLIRLRKLKGQSRFIIDTPSATAAARGTAFIVHAYPARTTLLVESGVVGLSAANTAVPTQTDQELQVWAWQKATVEESALPVPQLMTPSDWNQLEELREEPLPPSVRPEPVGLLRRFEGHTKDVRSVAFSPDGKTCASVAFDLTVRLWEVETGREMRQMKIPGSLPNSVLAFSPDGETLFYGFHDQVLMWDVGTGQEIRRVKIEGIAPEGEIKTLSSDGRFAGIGDGKTIRLWDIEKEQDSRRFEGHQGRVLSIAISSDNKRILSGSEDKTMRLWDVATGRELRRFDGDNEVRTVFFSPDGHRALFYSEIGTPPNQKYYIFHLWDVDNWREIHQLLGSGLAVFTPDGRRALLAAPANDWNFYDLTSGDRFCHFQHSTDSVYSLVVSPDGTRAISGGVGLVRLWSLPTLQPQQPFMEDYETTPVGQQASGASFYEAAAQVTKETAASGKQCLKVHQVSESSGPLLAYYPNFNSGVVMSRFDLKLRPGTVFISDWREGTRGNFTEILTPESVGPSLHIDGNGSLNCGGQQLAQLPHSQWMRFEIVCGLGAQATGKFDLTVRVPGRAPLVFKDLPCDPNFKYLKVLNFVSFSRPLPQTFYLDNVQVRLHP